MYDKQTRKVSNWGYDALEKEVKNEHDVKINNFMDELYLLFKKSKNTWNENDKLLIKAVSDFIYLAVKESMEDKDIKNKSLDSFYYGFIVPSEWQEEIREDLLRPMFIQAGLLSKEDHKDRLLFFSDLECTCYYYYIWDHFKRKQNTVVARLTPTGDCTVLIKLDLVKTLNTLFDFPNAKLFPKKFQSNSLYINFDDVKECIKTFLKDKLFIKDNDQKITVEEIVDWIYDDITSGKVI